MKNAKFYIDHEAYEYLTQWAEARITATKFCPPYFRRVEVIVPEYKNNTRFFVESTRYGYKFTLSYEGRIRIHGKMIVDDTGENDYQLPFNMPEWDDELVYLMQVYCTAFIHANCFMWYGSVAESRYDAVGKNDNNTKIITFRKHRDSVYAVSLGHHRSPEGVFEVRGHLRHYKSGKVIWIDPYIKGIDDKED